MTGDTRPTAVELNAHLARGGVVQVTTYTRSTLYRRAHAGWFEERAHGLYVRHGRGRVALSIGARLIVGIRTGRAPAMPEVSAG